MSVSKKSYTIRIGELHLERLDELVEYYADFYRKNSPLDIKITKANVMEIIIVREYDRVFGENKEGSNGEKLLFKDDILLNPIPSVHAQKNSEDADKRKSLTKKSFTARLSEAHLEKLEKLVEHYADYYRKSSPLDIRLTKSNVTELLIINEYEFVFGNQDVTN
ncbi:hypothetical protein ABC382_00590 [Lysinibacillus sp. 1P01SD]|uniref:hypothetical protein n=1 Tax=Lysinibacillus sp. 1P01SD TaxID=3132285 RepID=UPI0039A2148C